MSLFDLKRRSTARQTDSCLSSQKVSSFYEIRKFILTCQGSLSCGRKRISQFPSCSFRIHFNSVSSLQLGFQSGFSFQYEFLFSITRAWSSWHRFIRDFITSMALSVTSLPASPDPWLHYQHHLIRDFITSITLSVTSLPASPYPWLYYQHRLIRDFITSFAWSLTSLPASHYPLLHYQHRLIRDFITRILFNMQ